MREPTAHGEPWAAGRGAPRRRGRDLEREQSPGGFSPGGSSTRSQQGREEVVPRGGGGDAELPEAGAHFMPPCFQQEGERNCKMWGNYTARSPHSADGLRPWFFYPNSHCSSWVEGAGVPSACQGGPRVLCRSHGPAFTARCGSDFKAWPRRMLRGCQFLGRKSG